MEKVKTHWTDRVAVRLENWLCSKEAIIDDIITRLSLVVCIIFGLGMVYFASTTDYNSIDGLFVGGVGFILVIISISVYIIKSFTNK